MDKNDSKNSPRGTKQAPDLGRRVAERYEVLSLLGRGGMGHVYLAKDLFLGNEVALKVLKPGLSDDEKYQARFFREVEITKKIEHKNVVRTFDMGQDITTGSLYFSMEHVPGESLAKILEQGPFDVSKIPALTIEICEGLQAIHNQGVVHRDLKPENVIIGESFSAKITDFGVARVENSDVTAHDEILGSVCYVAPEVWAAKNITPKVDLYSLGVILYELCTGCVPFESESHPEMMRLHLEGEPRAPIALNASIDTWLSKLVLWLLKKSPEERPTDANEVIEFVEMYMAQKAEDLSNLVGGKSNLFIKGEKKTVLSVDDDPQVRNLVKAILENANYEVISASNAAEALAMLAEDQMVKKLCCAVLDVQMLDMSGYELLESLKAQPKTVDLPVLMLTSLSSSEDMFEGYNQGVDYFVSKPFTADQLLHGVKLVTTR